MKTYFRIVGVLELAAWVVGVVFIIVDFVKSVYAPSDIYIISFIIYLLVGPALGLLFLSHAANIEATEDNEAAIKKEAILRHDANKNKSKMPKPTQTNTNNATKLSDAQVKQMQNDYVECPKCKNLVLKSQLFCPNCGHQL